MMRSGWAMGLGSILLVGLLAAGCGRSSGGDDEGGGSGNTPTNPWIDDGSQNPSGGSQDQNQLPGDGTNPGGETNTGGGDTNTGGGDTNTGGDEGGGGDEGEGGGDDGNCDGDSNWKPYPDEYYPHKWCGVFSSEKDISFLLVTAECLDKIKYVSVFDLENLYHSIGPAQIGEKGCDWDTLGYKFEYVDTHKVLVCVAAEEGFDPSQLTVQLKAGLECENRYPEQLDY